MQSVIALKLRDMEFLSTPLSSILIYNVCSIVYFCGLYVSEIFNLKNSHLFLGHVDFFRGWWSCWVARGCINCARNVGVVIVGFCGLCACEIFH